MNDPTPLTDAQKIRIFEQAQDMMRWQQLFTIAQQGLSAAASRFQSDDATKEVPEIVPAQPMPEPAASAIPATATLVLRDCNGDFLASDANGQFLYGKQDLTPPFELWTTVDGAILRKQHVWLEEGQWWMGCVKFDKSTGDNNG